MKNISIACILFDTNSHYNEEQLLSFLQGGISDGLMMITTKEDALWMDCGTDNDEEQEQTDR